MNEFVSTHAEMYLGPDLVVFTQDVRKYFSSIAIHENHSEHSDRQILLFREPTEPEDHLTLYHGLKTFYRDNPDLLIPCSRYFTDTQEYDVVFNLNRLKKISEHPTEQQIQEEIKEGLTGYQAFSWTHGKKEIPIEGMKGEDFKVYRDNPNDTGILVDRPSNCIGKSIVQPYVRNIFAFVQDKTAYKKITERYNRLKMGYTEIEIRSRASTFG